MRINALESDLSDGLRLIALIEVRFRLLYVTEIGLIKVTEIGRNTR